jgi:hypothetical protein
VKGPHVDLGCAKIEEKGAIAKTKGTTQNHNLKSFQSLNVMANHARRSWSFTTNEICGVEEFCELKKVELIATKCVISNVLWFKSELEAKVKHLHFQMEDRKVACVKAKMEMDILLSKFIVQKKEVEKLQESLVGFGGGE